ncbi:MAG TPA: transposase, partial [Vicinamibacteria bacterium]|nr:transposase [Vicinamibacteria bacterium]
MIHSLHDVVEQLRPAFTAPAFAAGCDLLLAWVMCLGQHTLGRVGRTARADRVPDHSCRHGLDVYYNFFERSAWSPTALAQRVGVLLLTRLKLLGTITLLVDDTLAHKRGQSVWGLGWFRDAVASTRKRVATASGHNWVVLAVAYRPPFTGAPVLALPLLARLRRPGKGQPGCAALARQMVDEVLGWWPGRRFTLVGDGAYACAAMLEGLDERVTFVGRLRGDAALYDPRVPAAPRGKRGPKAQKGPRLPSPKQAAAKADRKRKPFGEWLWREVAVTAYGRARSLRALAYDVVWPSVAGLRPLQVVVVRDPSGRLRDCYLFTTDVSVSPGWVITQFAWRWSVEVLFRASKQVMDLEAPQHFCQSSVEKVAPWVWSMQSVIMVWYVTAGQASPEAEELRARMGEWDSEWSLRHMVDVLRRAILNVNINPDSADEAQLR